MNCEILRNISSGRLTVVTDEGSEIDVINFIADVFKHDPRLVAMACHQACGTTVQQVEEMMQ